MQCFKKKKKHIPGFNAIKCLLHSFICCRTLKSFFPLPRNVHDDFLFILEVQLTTTAIFNYKQTSVRQQPTQSTTSMRRIRA